MPAKTRFKTRYPGVYYIEGRALGSRKKERIFYIIYRKNGKIIEEKAGRQHEDGITAKKAAAIRAECISGKRLPRREIQKKKENKNSTAGMEASSEGKGDIIRQKLLEEKWFLFMESATEGFGLLDADLNILEANSAAIEMVESGIKGMNIIGKNINEFMPEAKEGGLFDKFIEVIKTGEAFSSEREYMLPPKFGEHVYLVFKAFRVGNGLGLIVRDITERKRDERKLKKREAELEEKTKALEDINTALKVLLKKREEDKSDLQKNVVFNIEKLIRPNLEKLKEGRLDFRQKTRLEIMESNLNDVVSPFLPEMSQKLLSLSPIEIRVANFIKQGKTTKEIAELFSLSTKTIDFHRDTIRKKLGIKNKKINLKTFLLSNK